MIINTEEILHYLNIPKLKANKELLNLIESCKKEIIDNSQIKTQFWIMPIHSTVNDAIIFNTNYKIKSRDLAKHLKNSSKIAFLACTLGHSIDKLINYYSHIDMKRSLVLDATASAAIESIVEAENHKIANLFKQNNTLRYSPGYGDLPLKINKKLSTLLNLPKSLGIYVNDSYLLTPQKSVIAIIGNRKTNNQNSICKMCSLNSCTHCRKE